MASLDIKNLSFQYNTNVIEGENKGTEFTLKNINLSVSSGEFLVLCGNSGSGKSTLLRLLKRQLSPCGRLEGEILIDGRGMDSFSEEESVRMVGYVAQNPETQIVSDRVFSEIAFVLESLGESSSVIRRRVAEICGYFGIESWYNRETAYLSGGQKQLLNLASVMVGSPEILLLDEPTAHLDPIASSDFLAKLKKLNEEIGTTIILVEQRLEEVFCLADRVAVLESGQLITSASPRLVAKAVAENKAEIMTEKALGESSVSLALPAAARIFAQYCKEGDCPLSVREGRSFLSANFANSIRKIGKEKQVDNSSMGRGKNDDLAVEIRDGYFRYSRNSPDVLRGISLEVVSGELLCLLGGNGVGKTTIIEVMAGINKLYSGWVKIFGKKLNEYGKVELYRNNIAYLPQYPELMFVKDRLVDDLREVTKLLRLDEGEEKERIEEVANLLSIHHLLLRHPYDLSGGEKQKAGLAKLLLLNPKVILMDEVTKGLDANAKKMLADIITSLKFSGKTIVMVTHDVEFAAENADRCAMLFDGSISAVESTREFFAANRYYTTATSRITKGYYDNVVTVSDAKSLVELNAKV